MANETQPVLTGIPFDAYQRRRLAEELRDAPQLDKTQPGGVYRGADGELHDANGKPVKGKAAAAPDGDDGGEADPLEGVELTPAAKTRAQEAGLTAEDFKRKRASGASGDFTVEDVERIAEAKKNAG
jgi:pyruvate/2-oxoglutarate dehydrogenase complex dihydrolipoamide acyltransferase (E2) component